MGGMSLFRDDGVVRRTRMPGAADALPLPSGRGPSCLPQQAGRGGAW